MSAERPNNHRLIRLVTASAVLTGAGTVVTGKVILDELSKPKAAASVITEDKMPSQAAFDDQVRMLTPTEAPASAVATVTRVPSPSALPESAPTSSPSASPTTAPATTTKEPSLIATAIPLPEIRPLTPEIKVLSAQNTDIVSVDTTEEEKLYEAAVSKGENKSPIPVLLGETGIIEEFVAPNGIRSLVIKKLKVGETYTVVAYTDGQADGYSKEDNLKYSPNRKHVGVNFYPENKSSDAKYAGFISYGFPPNASIRPKFFGPDDKKGDIKEFRAGEVLATFKVNPPDSPEQKEFEALFGPGSSMLIGFMTQDGVNKEPISFADVFLQDSLERPVALNGSSSK